MSVQWIDRPQPTVVQRVCHPPVIAEPLAPAGGTYATFQNALGLTGASARVESRYIWREKVETSRKFLRGKRIEVQGKSYYPPAVGDLVQFHIGVARVSHVGGFKNWEHVKQFLYDAESLTLVSAKEFEDMAMDGSGPNDFLGGRGFWVALEWYPVAYNVDK
eukprot:55589-Rhodomonas_salina.1